MSDRFRIGIVSGKLGDVDGVSLEVDKWISQLQAFGHTPVTIAGRYANPLTQIPRENQIVLDTIDFDSPRQKYYEKLVFPYLHNSSPPLKKEIKKELLENMAIEGSEVASRLHEFVQENEIDVIIAQNTNAMPMTLLGGLGVYELATRMQVATIFHHHDFWWERSRFSHNYIETLLNRIMPPVDLSLEHVVLTTYAEHILKSLKRIQPFVIPNCEDFADPPVLDEYNRHFREDFGFDENDILIVQPTRIVRRKRIEDSVALVGKLIQRHPTLASRVHYIISLYQGDEPDKNYIEVIKDMAGKLGVPLHLISHRVSSVRGSNGEGQRLYTNRDVLVNADLVTYLPIWEGFGNALLEATAARVPIVTTTYLVYKTDIKPTGVENIELRARYDESGMLLISDEAVDQMHYLLTHPESRSEIVNKNFESASGEFALDTLRSRLQRLLADYADEIRASRKRVKKSKRAYSV
jgi:glycosyltransferase involved in cell wall biosynthesis